MATHVTGNRVNYMHICQVLLQEGDEVMGDGSREMEVNELGWVGNETGGNG